MYSKVFYFAVLSGSVFSSNAHHPVEEIADPRSETEDETEYTVEIRSTLPDGHGIVECNGGIIANDVIVTTASCVINDNYEFDDIFRMIHYNPLAISRDLNIESIHSIYVPLSYNSTTLRDNIAVIKLRIPIDLKKNGLRKLEILPKAFKIGDDAEMTTTGLYNKSFRYMENDLLTFETPFNVIANSKVIDNSECRKMNPELDGDVTLCAKLIEPNRQRFDCDNKVKATRGSVLVTERTSIIGLSARERNLCKETEDVQIYTDVYSQKDFITNAMNNRSLDTMFRLTYLYDF